MTLVKAQRIEIEDILLEADTHGLMEKIDELEAHIKRTIPDELIYVHGNINTGTRWGAILHHITMLRATLRAFV